jgi:hypothetical protein
LHQSLYGGHGSKWQSGHRYAGGGSVHRRNSWHQPEKLFALLDQFYPVPNGKNLRPLPYMPYLNWAPSAWVLPLKFDGGGYRAGGGAMFDSEGNLWIADNFTVGWQGQDSLWQGHATKFAPNGRPISPNITGFTGGGMEGGTFGAAVDATSRLATRFRRPAGTLVAAYRCRSISTSIQRATSGLRTTGRT